MFRFTIRDMFWLMVVVACVCGWWIERSADRRRFENWQEATYLTFLDKLNASYETKYQTEIETLKKENAALKAASANAQSD